MTIDSVSSQERHREVFFSLTSRHLKSLYHFVRHQLAYREAVGDLLPGELTPEEVVDGVLLRAYREFVKKPPEQRIGSWLVRLAREYLDAEVKRLKTWRNRTPVRLEEDFRRRLRASRYPVWARRSCISTSRTKT